jgi:hypothetical protein
MYIFVTTQVNYRDTPAGCMAMAVVLETVERSSEGDKQAPSFCRKKVNDAIAKPADIKIIERGGSRCMESVMTGDHPEKLCELSKVLGLR